MQRTQPRKAYSKGPKMRKGGGCCTGFERFLLLPPSYAKAVLSEITRAGLPWWFPLPPSEFPRTMPGCHGNAADHPSRSRSRIDTRPGNCILDGVFVVSNYSDGLHCPLLVKNPAQHRSIFDLQRASETIDAPDVEQDGVNACVQTLNGCPDCRNLTHLI